ncbi:MAG TPA: prepilin-type N-terminal cleavage/methylation domain-containing protein [Gemmatimonadales bacterium]|nr:prepilin-type N-terminal cleavage/methylation domain-containing protein [Gemmatimonadales bacterium]
MTIISVRRTQGFTLVEVMVSVTILAVGILILGGLLVRSARSAEAASAISYQTAILAAEVARYDAVPFSQLVAGTTCDTVSTGPLPRIRCTTIADVTTKLRQVRVRVTPTDNPLLQPDSVVFERSISGNGTPLNTP